MSTQTQFVFSKRVGDRNSFAVEFEGHRLPGGPGPRLWNELWGYLWLWVEGHLVGNPFELEMVTIGLESLQTTALETGCRQSRLLSAQTSTEALEIVLRAIYGDDDPVTEELTPDWDSLAPFEVLPGRTGPFFDGWEAILLETGTTEQFVYRQEGKPTIDAVWPLGTFRDAVLEATSEFEKLARYELGPRLGVFPSETSLEDKDST